MVGVFGTAYSAVTVERIEQSRQTPYGHDDSFNRTRHGSRDENELAARGARVYATATRNSRCPYRTARSTTAVPNMPQAGCAAVRDKEQLNFNQVPERVKRALCMKKSNRHHVRLGLFGL